MSGKDRITAAILLILLTVIWTVPFAGTVDVPTRDAPQIDPLIPIDDFSEVSAGEGSGWSFRVNINDAPIGDLVILPGIGPKLGEKIITARSENGPFTIPEDLEKVKGIGPKKRAKIEPFLIFSTP